MSKKRAVSFRTKRGCVKLQTISQNQASAHTRFAGCRWDSVCRAFRHKRIDCAYMLKQATFPDRSPQTRRRPTTSPHAAKLATTSWKAHTQQTVLTLRLMLSKEKSKSNQFRDSARYMLAIRTLASMAPVPPLYSVVSTLYWNMMCEEGAVAL